MSRLEDPSEIEGIVGIKRHQTVHFGRAVSSEERVYVLHSRECLDSGIDLRKCAYSLALDNGIDMKIWADELDKAVPLLINMWDELEPISDVSETGDQQ